MIAWFSLSYTCRCPVMGSIACSWVAYDVNVYFLPYTIVHYSTIYPFSILILDRTSNC